VLYITGGSSYLAKCISGINVRKVGRHIGQDNDITYEEFFKEKKPKEWRLVHIACSNGRAEETTFHDYNFNYYFSKELYEYCKKAKVSHFLNVGTFYRNNESFQDGYSKGKRDFWSFCEKLEDCTNLEIQHMYGDGDHDRKLLPSLISSALTNREIVLSNPYEKRDFVYVKDVAKLIMKIASRPAHGPYYIGTGAYISILELSSLIGNAIKRKYGIEIRVIADVQTNPVSWELLRDQDLLRCDYAYKSLESCLEFLI
jgi:CDP-paratose synthetase